MSVESRFPDQHICIIGMGYVGLTLAVAMADAGFKVHGVEIRNEVVEGLKRANPHFWEPHLKEKLDRVIDAGSLTLSQTLDAGTVASVYIITVGTPLDENGLARLGFAEDATQQVVGHMTDGALIIMRSTVKLSTTRKVVMPLLQSSGKKFQLAYCPERTLQGRALTELHELPQIIGAEDQETRLRCQQLFERMTPTTIAVSSLDTAELIKLVDNTYRDLTFGFANEIAKLCAYAGLSAREVISAGKFGYPRTGIPMPGPVGGPCLEKDSHILVESAKQWGVDMPIALAGRLTNENQPKQIASMMKIWAERLPGFSTAPRIGILGLAFKGTPATDDLRGTMALPICNELRKVFPSASFCSYDPLVASCDALEYFGFGVLDNINSVFDASDMVIIQNNNQVFQSMDVSSLAEQLNRPGIIYDLWNLHDDVTDTMPEGIVALSLGNERI